MSIIIRQFGGLGSGGGTIEVPATPVARYLHELTLGAVVSDPQSSLASAAMESNGLRVTLQDPTGATPLSMANAVIWSWPLPLDILGNAVATMNLGRRIVQLQVLEREVSTLPMQVGIVFGLHEGADPNAAGVEGYACGIEYLGTTLRSVVGWRKVAGTWTRTISTAGQATCFGAELTPNRHAITNIANNKINPLDASFTHNVAGSNIVDITTTVTNIDAITHQFVAVYFTATTGPASPSFKFDTSLQIFPDIPAA
jgi:hypothetical protein